jgi:hypothetical protein
VRIYRTSQARTLIGAMLAAIGTFTLSGILVTLPAAPASAAGPPAVTLAGLDLHDGTVLQLGRTIYAYGTRYGCGFNWGHPGSPWCGYGVSEATSLTGPWTARRYLFSAHTVIRASWPGDNGRTWDAVCGDAGCFNPRMVRAPDGTWLLWFNAPGDKARGANPYWVMTCTGPAGPCGTPRKPAIWGCDTGGDFSIAVSADQAGATLICSGRGHNLTTEALTANFANGTRAVNTHVAPGRNEGVGVYYAAGMYTAVFSDPGCSYCSGPPEDKAAAPGYPTSVQAGYSTAPGLAGPWTYRGILSDGPCTGQPRSTFTVNGQPYEWDDEWNGTSREASARVLLIPLGLTPWSCAA